MEPTCTADQIRLAHLANHGRDLRDTTPLEHCPHCQAATLLKTIHAAYFDRNLDHGRFKALYALSDGYGEQGFVPAQGYDWSGVRDSSPAAVAAMYDLVRSWGY